MAERMLRRRAAERLTSPFGAGDVPGFGRDMPSEDRKAGTSAGGGITLPRAARATRRRNRGVG